MNDCTPVFVVMMQLLKEETMRREKSLQIGRRDALTLGMSALAAGSALASAARAQVLDKGESRNAFKARDGRPARMTGICVPRSSIATRCSTFQRPTLRYFRVSNHVHFLHHADRSTIFKRHDTDAGFSVLDRLRVAGKERAKSFRLSRLEGKKFSDIRPKFAQHMKCDVRG